MSGQRGRLVHSFLTPSEFDYRRLCRLRKLASLGETVLLRMSCDEAVSNGECTPEAAAVSFPKVLVLDPTRIGSLTATGQFKAALFDGWPQDRLMEIAREEPGILAVLPGNGVEVKLPAWDIEGVLALCDAFSPEIIYCRPDDFAIEHLTTCVRILHSLKQPAVLHIMDDWHGLRMREKSAHFTAIDAIVRYLMQRCVLRFTDGQAYIDDYGERFGVRLKNLLNSVNLDNWRASVSPTVQNSVFTLTHMGNLEPLMSRQAIIDIAAAVEGLKDEFDIQLNVYVKDYQAPEAMMLLERFRSTHVKLQHESFEVYKQTLCGSDLNLYAYNSDPESVQYIGKGIPNKTCEVLAAGKPVLAYGSGELACIRYMRDNNLAHVVTEPSKQALKDSIRSIWMNRGDADKHLEIALQFIRQKHDRHTVRTYFRRELLGLINAEAEPNGSGELNASEEIERAVCDLEGPFRRPAASGLASVEHHCREDKPSAPGPRFLARVRTHGASILQLTMTTWRLSKPALVLTLGALIALGAAVFISNTDARSVLFASAAFLTSAYLVLVAGRHAFSLSGILVTKLKIRNAFLGLVGQGALNFLQYKRKLLITVAAIAFSVLALSIIGALTLALQGQILPAWLVFFAGAAFTLAAVLVLCVAAPAYGVYFALQNRLQVYNELHQRFENDQVLLGDQLASLANAQSQLNDRVEKLASDLAVIFAASQVQLEEKLQKAASDQAGALSQLEEKVQGVALDQAGALSQLEEKVQSIALDLQQLGLTNRGAYQVFGRYLSEAARDELVGQWGAAMNVSLKPAQLSYFAHRIEVVESQCVGRLATEIEASIIRTLVVWAIAGRSASVLEIGTLFGVSMAAIYDICRPKFSEMHLTVVDPLDGYYESGAADILINVPVTEQVFRDNMKRVGVSPDEFTVIRGLSQETSVIERASKRQYDVIIIDGDHTYEGVKNDFEHYAPFVKEGGYILFDDYGVEEWFGVTNYVDAEIRQRSDLKFVGVGPRTAVFQVAAPIPAPHRT